MHEFHDLRGTDEDPCDTLAYWIGVVSTQVERFTAEALGDAMSYQYDIEEQAGYTGYVFHEDSDWLDCLAPVQLAKAWSPYAAATRFLGPPAWTTISKSKIWRRLVCAWFPPTVEKARNAVPRKDSTADERRFLSLLAVAGERACAKGLGILLVAQPGWSYDSGLHRFDPATDRAMRQVGFAVLDRRL